MLVRIVDLSAVHVACFMQVLNKTEVMKFGHKRIFSRKNSACGALIHENLQQGFAPGTVKHLGLCPYFYTLVAPVIIQT